MVIPVKTGIQDLEEANWIPACAGMTTRKTGIGKVDFKSTVCLRTPRLRGEGGSVRKPHLIKLIDAIHSLKDSKRKTFLTT